MVSNQGQEKKLKDAFSKHPIQLLNFTQKKNEVERNVRSSTSKMAQWVKPLIAKPDNQSSVPEVHIVARENLLL